MGNYTKKWRVGCNSCQKESIVRDNSAPQFCSYCGSKDIKVEQEVSKAAIAGGQRCLAKLEKIRPDIIDARNRYIELRAAYEYEMQTLRTYVWRGIISKEEAAPYMAYGQELKRMSTALKEYREQKKREHRGSKEAGTGETTSQV